MRRSTSIITVLGLLGLILWEGAARAENPDRAALSPTVNQAPFPGVSLVDPVQKSAGEPSPESLVKKRNNPFPPSASPRSRGDAPGIPDRPGDGSGRSLGNLFDLERQEALLKKELSIQKLKDQLKGHGPKKVLETGSRGAPITLLAAGFEGNRYAILEWNDGRRIRIRQGETLPDGSRVVRIDGSGVSVRTRGGVRTYPYGGSSESRQGGRIPTFPLRGAGGFMPLPPPPSAGGRP